MSADRTLVDAALTAAAAALERARRQDPAPLLAAADTVLRCVRAGGKVLLFGNGGSAADAQHVAAELVVRYARTRRAVAALALSTDSSILTAVGNDRGFDDIFARQIEALGARGDVAVAISTSGASPNVLRGVEAARRSGMTTVAFTGRDGGALGSRVDIHVNVPESDTPRIQEVHRTLLHVLCELVEREL